MEFIIHRIEINTLIMIAKFSLSYKISSHNYVIITYNYTLGNMSLVLIICILFFLYSSYLIYTFFFHLF